MRSINVYFEDEEYEKLKELKADRSWKELILSLIKSDGKENENRGKKSDGREK